MLLPLAGYTCLSTSIVSCLGKVCSDFSRATSRAAVHGENLIACVKRGSKRLTSAVRFDEGHADSARGVYHNRDTSSSRSAPAGFRGLTGRGRRNSRSFDRSEAGTISTWLQQSLDSRGGRAHPHAVFDAARCWICVTQRHGTGLRGRAHSTLEVSLRCAPYRRSGPQSCDGHWAAEHRTRVPSAAQPRGFETLGLTTISTRRLMARPSGVSFDAIGRSSPRPAARMLLVGMPWLIR